MNRAHLGNRSVVLAGPGRKLTRILLRGVLVAGAVLLLVPVFFPSVLPRIEARLERRDERLSRHLGDKGLVFLLTFDRPGGREWISGSRPQMPGVEVDYEGGIFGARFTGTRWSAIQTPVSWRVAGTGHTLLVRIKLLPPSLTQEIMFFSGGVMNTGLKLEEGEVRWYIPGAEDQVLSYPFERWGEYVEIVGTVDPLTGRAELYENGELRSSGRVTGVAFPDQGINFGLTRWYAARQPLHAVLAEAAIWNRPLAAGEISRLSHRRRTLPGFLAPGDLREMKFWKVLAGGAREIQRVVDYLAPRNYSRNSGLAELRLQLRGRPLREMNLAHSGSRLSGRRTAEGARFHDVLVMADGGTVWGTVALDGSDTRYGASPRKAFILELPEPVFAGLKSVRLTPPEEAGWLIPLMDSALAAELDLDAVSNGLCRLYLNGRFAGVYYYEDDARRGVAPQTAESFLYGPDNPNHWTFPFERRPAAQDPPRGPPRHGIPLTAERIAGLYDELEAKVFPELAADLAAPFNRGELKRALRDLRDRRGGIWVPSSLGSLAEQAAAYLVPELLLGANPAAYYIREDLDLEIFPGLPLDIRWTSSRPDLISPEGGVRLPEGDLPVEVELTAEISAGRGVAEKRLAFRVMPLEPRIRALMFYFNEPLQKTRRVDLRIEHYPRDIFSPVEIRAFQGRRSGIKFRGNTSFWQTSRPGPHDWALRKMPFSVRCEEPPRILNDSETHHFYLGTGYSDTSLMRNKLSYDLFRAMGEAGGELRPAPDNDWAEVFVNGRYRGLYELGSRVDRHLLGWERYEPDRADPAVLYKFEGGNNLSEVIKWAVKIKYPPLFYGAHFEPYEKLVEVIASPTAEEFADKADEVVNIPAVIDWQLLLNYAGNLDGRVDEFYLVRAAGEDARFTILPWDYDKTFGGRAPRWLENALPCRLRRDYPGYREAMAMRWRSLREGPFSATSIAGRIDEMEHHLTGYARWDYQLWDERYSRGVTLAESVADLRRRALNRLNWMDEVLDGRAGGS